MQKVRELVTALSLQVRLVPSWNWTCSISHLMYSCTLGPMALLLGCVLIPINKLSLDPCVTHPNAIQCIATEQLACVIPPKPLGW